jgi:hypothetical protein
VLSNIITGFVGILVGGAVASVTVVGLVNGQVNRTADVTSNVDQPVITYGTR